MSGKDTAATTIIDEALAALLVPSRSAGAHKWSVGGVVIIGGAPGYIGAPALAARAASRSGAGIVTIAVSRGSVGPIATLVPEATFVPLPEGEPRAAAKRAVEAIGPKIDRSQSIVAGPGLSQDDHATALLSALVGFSDLGPGAMLGFGAARQNGSSADDSRLIGGATPAVLDADALNWLATQEDWWTRVTPWSLVLTPHVGEMERLTGTSADEIVSDPARCAMEFAATWQQTVLLKSGRSVVTDGKRALSSESTPPSLASAGTGDVLAGSVGAFLAQGLDPIDACSLAMYAGEAAARAIEQEVGVLGLIASDLPDQIARELHRLARKAG